MEEAEDIDGFDHDDDDRGEVAEEDDCGALAELRLDEAVLPDRDVFEELRDDALDGLLDDDEDGGRMQQHVESMPPQPVPLGQKPCAARHAALSRHVSPVRHAGTDEPAPDREEADFEPFEPLLAAEPWEEPPGGP